MLLESDEDAALILPHAGIGFSGVSENLPSWVPDLQMESQKPNNIFSLQG
jgi:hypothetical protein